MSDTSTIELNQETNLIGTITSNIQANSTQFTATFIDKVTGQPRAPQTTTLEYTIDQSNSSSETILASSVTTDVNGVTTIVFATNGRVIPKYGTGPGSSTGLSHVIGASIGCVDIARPLNLIAQILDQKANLDGAAFTGPVTLGGATTYLGMPSLTTTQRNALVSPQNGWQIFNSTNGEIETYIGGVWIANGTSTTPFSSPGVAGTTEVATVAQQVSHTSVGPSGALLVPQVGNFITISGGSGDAGKVVVLASNGQYDPSVIPTSGLSVAQVQETYPFGANINGTSTPVAVYMKASDGKIYPTDSSSTEGTYKFIGFVTTNVSSGSNGIVIVGGNVPGFTGLTTDSDYYLNGTGGSVGAISTTGGTNIYKVCRATSTTAILIEKGTKMMAGTDVFSSGSGGVSPGTTTNTVVTLGFKPKIVEWQYYIEGHDTSAGTGFPAISAGIVTFLETTQVACLQLGKVNANTTGYLESLTIPRSSLAFGTTLSVGNAGTVGSGWCQITISLSAISDTGFTITKNIINDSGSNPTGYSTILWRAWA